MSFNRVREFKNNLMEFANGTLDDSDIITVTAMVYDAVMMAGTVRDRNRERLLHLLGRELREDAKSVMHTEQHMNRQG